MSDNISHNVQLDFIRYANCWEDPEVLLKGLNLGKGKRILSIASAGDNSFALLTTEPELVVAFDLNPTQLYLVELKKVAIQQLSREETIAFLGFTENQHRLKTYEGFKQELSPEALKFWEKNQFYIKTGVIHCGKFEKYFQLFGRRILPFIHTKKRVEALLSKKSEEEQKQFYDHKWNTWRWRLLFKIFFSKAVMGKKGRDPQFLKEVKLSVGTFIFNKAAKQLSSTLAQDNFILRYNLTGNFATLLPHYLQEENYDVIRKNLSKLEIFNGTTDDAIAHFGKFDGMNLSDIFEYMDPKTFAQIGKSLYAGLNEGGTIGYWNLMVPRVLSNDLPEHFELNEALSSALTSIDKGFFYYGFYSDKAIQ